MNHFQRGLRSSLPLRSVCSKRTPWSTSFLTVSFLLKLPFWPWAVTGNPGSFLWGVPSAPLPHRLLQQPGPSPVTDHTAQGNQATESKEAVFWLPWPKGDRECKHGLHNPIRQLADCCGPQPRAMRCLRGSGISAPAHLHCKQRHVLRLWQLPGFLCQTAQRFHNVFLHCQRQETTDLAATNVTRYYFHMTRRKIFWVRPLNNNPH